MKQPNPKPTPAKKPASKEKKQVLILGGLGVVLGLVMYMQFGTDPAPPDPEDMVEMPPPIDLAAAKSAKESVSVSVDGVAPDNEILSADENEGLEASPFTRFWSDMTEASPEEQVEELAVPNVTLNGTMPSDVDPLATIENRIYRLGDVVQGWTIQEIGPRTVRLVSPTNSAHTLEMFLLDPLSGSSAASGDR